jgi:sporulation protein YlmC with PRC-barrel domain
MFKTLNQLSGSSVTATDGLIGHVKEAFFDDRSWAIRYLVVDAGTWLSGREVLISPYSVTQPLSLAKNINVVLTRQQVKDSPDIDTHQPISRQHEKQFMGYYAYPGYWYGGDMWGMGQHPILPTLAEIDTAEAERQRDLDAVDIHLRNSAKVAGYDIQASDGSIGHVQDFVFDEASWAIRYLVLDTQNWWPGGKKVLLAKQWIDRIDWETKSVYVRLTREQIKKGPEYDETLAIDRGYEQRLHDAHNRKGYWI